MLGPVMSYGSALLLCAGYQVGETSGGVGSGLYIVHHDISQIVTGLYSAA